jgi:Tfp pilus assembly protein PilN
MIRVNLVPIELLARARQRQLMLQAAGVGAILATGVVLLSLSHWFSLFRLENDYKYDEAKLQSLKAIVSQVEELEKSAALVHSRLDVIESLLKGRAFYPLFMSDFARTVPNTVRVTQLSTTSQASNSVKLSISATALSSDDIATWMRTLQADANFQNIELGAVNGTGHEYTFTISAAYAIKL